MYTYGSLQTSRNGVLLLFIDLAVNTINIHVYVCPSNGIDAWAPIDDVALEPFVWSFT